jgi:glycine oxidase
MRTAGSSGSADVVIAGGGVIGLSIAWRAAEEGLRVTLCDPTPGHGATWAAAGMLAPVTEAHIGEEYLMRMNLEAAERWPAFAADLERASGTGVGYTPCGTVVVAADTSDMAVVDRILSFHRSLGLTSWRLTASECRELVPALAPGVRGGASSPSDHQVDNRLLVDALVRAVDAAGVDRISVPVKEVRISGGKATGVILDDGREVRAANVVASAGCWTSKLAGIPAGVLPPVRPVKGHILRLRGPKSQPLLERNVRCMVHGTSLYLVPREDGSIVVGATVEEKGYDTSVQAGAVYELLRDARTIVPGIAELELAESLAGLRPGSPDNGPFIGWTRIERLAVATGHYRNGILLAPVTADAMCAVLLGGDVPAVIEPFRADRATYTSAVSP